MKRIIFRRLIVVLFLFVIISCYREKRKVIVVSDVKYKHAYYQENTETIYIKGIAKEVDRGYSVAEEWCFKAKPIEDYQDTNIRSVSRDTECKKGDTLEIDLWEYEDIFNKPKKHKNKKKYEFQNENGNLKIEINDGEIIIINNVIDNN